MPKHKGRDVPPPRALPISRGQLQQALESLGLTFAAATTIGRAAQRGTADHVEVDLIGAAETLNEVIGRFAFPLGKQDERHRSLLLVMGALAAGATQWSGAPHWLHEHLQELVNEAVTQQRLASLETQYQETRIAVQVLSATGRIVLTITPSRPGRNSA